MNQRKGCKAMTQNTKSRFFLDIDDRFTVHKEGGCRYQDALIRWTFVGEFSSMEDAVYFSKNNKGYSIAIPCPQCS